MAVTNGDFETGDFTGWTVDNYGTPTTDTVDATAKYSGSYGWHAKCEVTSGQVTQADHYQTIDLTSIPSLKLRMNIIGRTVTGDGIAQVNVRIDADDNIYTSTSGYEEITIDTSSYSGNKTLEIIIDTQSYSSGTASLEVYIDDISTTLPGVPEASFTASAGTNTLTITFTDTSTNSPSSWDWDYGDGTAHGTTQNPEHTYATPGYYLVTLTATNVSGSDVTSVYSTVSARSTVAQVTGDSDPLNFTSAIVSKQITDACWKAEVSIPTEYTPPTTDDLPVITITVPDHTNTDQTIFYGVITNLQYTQTPVGITTKLICYDMAYYLVAQFVPIRSTTYSSSGSVYTPDQIVKRFLGTDTSATDWDHVTGIYPLNIDSVTGWGSSTSGSLATKGWTWANKTKKWQALVEICEYTDYMLYVYWKYNDPTPNEWCPVCYFVDSTDIDTGSPLDLPTKLTCTASTDPYLIGQITTTNQDDYKYNTVTIYGGVDANGDTLVGSSTAADVGSTIKPIEYIEENEAWTSQTLVDDVASAYLSYLNTPGDVYQATFAKRTDLRLCQLIEIDGYNQIPEEDMRITGISYNILPGSNTVNVTFTTDRKFAAIRKLRKVVRPTLWTEISTMTDDKVAAIMRGELITCVSNTSGSVVFQFENGEYGTGRGPS